MERTDYTTLRSIRGIGAVLIYIHHFGCDGPWTTQVGEFAVSLFFMLSGLVLASAYNYNRLPDTLTFFKKRLIKIYPIYLISLVAAIALKGCSLRALPFDLLLLQSWIPMGSYFFSGNSVSWFISSLLLCYVLFCPLMRAYTANSRRFLLLYLAGLAVYVAIVTVLPVKFICSIIYVFPIMQLPPFVAGMLVWMAFSKYPAEKVGKTAISLLQIAAISLIVVFATFYPYVDSRWGVASYWWIPDFALLYIMLVSERFDTPVNRLLRLRPMQIAGNVSFVFYLFHTIVMNIYRRLLEFTGIDLPVIPSSIVCMLLTFAIAWVLHYYVELPVAARLKRYVK